MDDKFVVEQCSENARAVKPYIRYKSGYKYQLVEDYVVDVNILPENSIWTDYIELNTDGRLIVKKGYAWDGPSGPTFDTPDFMRGSLVHDAFYQLMRNEFISRDWRVKADKELKRMCCEDGMSKIRAWWVYLGVRWGAGPAASPKTRKRVQVAP